MVASNGTNTSNPHAVETGVMGAMIPATVSAIFFRFAVFVLVGQRFPLKAQQA